MSDNPRALAHRARAAADILDAAADDGRPVPAAVFIGDHAGDVVKFKMLTEHDLRVWAQWRGIPIRDVTVTQERDSDVHTIQWVGEIYDQPVEVSTSVFIPETHDWDTPVRDEVPSVTQWAKPA